MIDSVQGLRIFVKYLPITYQPFFKTMKKDIYFIAYQNGWQIRQLELSHIGPPSPQPSSPCSPVCHLREMGLKSFKNNIGYVILKTNIDRLGIHGYGNAFFSLKSFKKMSYRIMFFVNLVKCLICVVNNVMINQLMHYSVYNPDVYFQFWALFWQTINLCLVI